MSSLYDKFRKSFGRNGPDYTVIENSVGRARNTLVSDLITNLDYHEALALGLLQSKPAVPHLLRMFADGSNEQRLASGRALWDIEGDVAYLKHTIAVIYDRETTGEFERINAIGLLLNINHADAFAALEFALFDPEYLVRYNAASIYSTNVSGRVDDRTIYRNIAKFDQPKIERYAKRLRAKIHT